MDDKLINTRQSFLGIYDGCNIIQSRYRHKPIRYTIVFKNVYFKKSQKIFRDHVHIAVPKNVFKQFKDLEVGLLEFSFTAKIYRYTQPPIKMKNLLYRPLQVGLKEIKKIESITDQEV